MRVLSLIDGAQGYCALLQGPNGAFAGYVGADEVFRATASGPPEEGRTKLDSEAGGLEISWSPAGPILEFAIAEAVVSVYAVAASGVLGGDAERSFSGPGVAWELPDSGFSALRTAWAVTAESDLLVLVAIRPDDARDHGEELVGAATIPARDEPYGYAEPLLSTEYDQNGIHTRATLELWTEDGDVAERGAGSRIAGAALPTIHGRLEAARFAWTLGGSAAVGGYEILTP